MINTAYCSARPPLLLLPSFPSCHVSICQCLKSTMLCQRCTLTPSKKKKSKKKKHTFCSLRNARPLEIKIPFHFCLKNLLPILNAMNYSTLYDSIFFLFYSQNQNQGGWKVTSLPTLTLCRNQALLGCVQLGLEHLPRWRLHSLATQPIPLLNYPLRGKEYVFKEASHISVCAVSLHSFPLQVLPV